MRRFAFLAAIAVALSFSNPASALTLQQAQDELADMFCSGSTCTSQTPGSRVETVVGEETVVIGHRGPAAGQAIELGRSSTCFYGNGWAMINVNPDTCTGNSLVLDGGGAITRDQPTYTDVTIDTITTVTKELIYNGPNTDRANAWSVSTTTETVDVP